ALLRVRVRMVEARAELLPEVPVAHAGQPLRHGQSGNIPPMKDAVEQRRAAPPVERPHEGLRAQHRVDRRPPLAGGGEKARLVLPALARAGPEAHALHDDGETRAVGELDETLAV